MVIISLNKKKIWLVGWLVAIVNRMKMNSNSVQFDAVIN